MKWERNKPNGAQEKGGWDEGKEVSPGQPRGTFWEATQCRDGKWPSWSFLKEFLEDAREGPMHLPQHGVGGKLLRVTITWQLRMSHKLPSYPSSPSYHTRNPAPNSLACCLFSHCCLPRALVGSSLHLALSWTRTKAAHGLMGVVISPGTKGREQPAGSRAQSLSPCGPDLGAKLLCPSAPELL